MLRTLGSGELADSGQSYPGHAYHDALAIARQEHVPLLEPRGGDVWRTDDGVVFPWPFVWGFAQGAAKYGAEVLPFTRVTGFQTRG